MNIRFATREDSKLIYSMLFELAKFEKLLNEFSATEEKLVELIFDSQNGFKYIILEDQNEAVGMAIFYISFVTFLSGKGLFLEDLYVSERHRGKGYGKELLKFLARTAQEMGCVRMEWNVLKWNRKAIDFYESIQAQALDEWVTYRMEIPAIKSLADS